MYTCDWSFFLSATIKKWKVWNSQPIGIFPGIVMLQNPFLCNGSFILLFNKRDAFFKYIKETPLKNAFPHYNGSMLLFMERNWCIDSYEEALQFVQHEFCRLATDNAIVYTHTMAASDAVGFNTLFSALHDNINPIIT